MDHWRPHDITGTFAKDTVRGATIFRGLLQGKRRTSTTDVLRRLLSSCNVKGGEMHAPASSWAFLNRSQDQEAESGISLIGLVLGEAYASQTEIERIKSKELGLRCKSRGGGGADVG